MNCPCCKRDHDTWTPGPGGNFCSECRWCDYPNKPCRNTVQNAVDDYIDRLKGMSVEQLRAEREIMATACNEARKMLEAIDR